MMSKSGKGNRLYLVTVILVALIIFCIVVLVSVKENPYFKGEKTSIYSGYHAISPSGDLRLPGTAWTVFGKFPKYRFKVFGLEFSKEEFVQIRLVETPNSYWHVVNTISADEAVDLMNRLNAAVGSLRASLEPGGQDSFATRNVIHTSGYNMEVSGSIQCFFVSDFRWDVRAEIPAREADSNGQKEDGHIRLRLHDLSGNAFPVESRLSVADAIALSKQLASALR